ncbi:MAG: ATP-binding protein [Rhodoglobus sp.]
MIIWLNGTFGAGKTTTAAALEPLWQNSRQFDPEWVGRALARNLQDIPFHNFQDLPPWRPLVVEMLDGVERLTGQNVISTQTVLNREYWLEIRAGLEARGRQLFHVVLESNEAILRSRIEQDEVEPEARGWRIDHISKYAEERSWMVEDADLVVRTDETQPRQVASLIMDAVSKVAR